MSELRDAIKSSICAKKTRQSLFSNEDDDSKRHREPTQRIE
jgi:hypothetical protein